MTLGCSVLPLSDLDVAAGAFWFFKHLDFFFFSTMVLGAFQASIFVNSANRSDMHKSKSIFLSLHNKDIFKLD